MMDESMVGSRLGQTRYRRRWRCGHHDHRRYSGAL